MYFIDKVVVKSKVYNSIPYDSLTDTASKSESEGYVSGRTEEGDMFAACVFAIIIVFVLIIFIYKIINFIYIRGTVDKINSK